MSGAWPVFDVERDSPTIGFLHLASQMPGKLRVAHAPWVNQGWHVTLHPTGEGLITAATDSGDGRTFTILLDLCGHRFALDISDGTHDQVGFEDGMSISNLHARFVAMLDRHGLPSKFDGKPNEIPDAIPFADDGRARAYRPESATIFREMLARIAPVFERFRAGFIGKASPVHFFWGSFDLAATRFSGRPAPPHPGGVPGLPDRITREAYSEEVSSAGFWPGNVAMPVPPIFYSYAYPEPAGFRDRTPEPSAARFNSKLGEFTLDYDAVRRSDNPAATLTQFLESTYGAAAELAGWDRKRFERKPVAP